MGRELFERCIRGALRSKTVLLVTNALQYLPHADNVVWLDKGRVRAQGTYAQLVEAGEWGQMCHCIAAVLYKLIPNVAVHCMAGSYRGVI